MSLTQRGPKSHAGKASESRKGMARGEFLEDRGGGHLLGLSLTSLLAFPGESPLWDSTDDTIRVGVNSYSLGPRCEGLGREL